MQREITGLIIRNTGSLYIAKCTDGVERKCIAKGSFRLKGIRTTNPVSAGDIVVLDLSSATDDSIYYIKTIQERRNYIIRRSTNLSKQSHIIASNLDLSFLICTISKPETSTTFIDRFLATSEAYSVSTQLVFNKIDLYSEGEMAYLYYLIDLYSKIGYKCHKVSALKGIGIDTLKEEMYGKISLFSGHSGVGKSSLINAIIPNAELRTGDISSSHNTGMHTTTFSEMIELDNDGSYLIDTPGIKAFGTIDIDPKEASHYFPEIFEASKECKFANCTHTHEPSCNVQKLIQEGKISASRYNSYLGIMEDKDQDKYRPEY